MQLGAVNSLNFRAKYQPVTEKEIDMVKTQEFVDAVRTWEDSVDFSNKETSEKKSVLATVGSLVTCAGGAFLIARSMTKKGINAFSNVKANEKVQEFLGSEKVQENLGKLTGAISGAGKAIAKKLPEGLTKALKGKAPEVVGVAAAAVATPYFATRDNNEDGIADMMQKGVNAYEGIADKVGQLKVLADILV